MPHLGDSGADVSLKLEMKNLGDNVAADGNAQICQIDGKPVKLGETTRQGQFDIQCNSLSSDITACYYKDEHGNERKLAVGQVEETEKSEHSCKRDEKNPNKITYFSERKKLFNQFLIK